MTLQNFEHNTRNMEGTEQEQNHIQRLRNQEDSETHESTTYHRSMISLVLTLSTLIFRL